MQIRKKFDFNGMHIVRNCSSERCKYSIHAHTYNVELFFESTTLDNGMMVLDFGLMKTTIRDIVKSFDKAYSMWDKESSEYKEVIESLQPRIVYLPTSPSAESYSIILYFIISKILSATEFNNGESVIKLSKVQVHETRTGYAEASKDDLLLVDYKLEDIIFTDEIKQSWNDPEMYDKLIEYTNGKTYRKPFINPKVNLQIQN